MLAVGDDKRELLSDALGGGAEQVRFVDMERLGRNPACIINVLVTNTIRHAGGRGVLRTWIENGTFLVEVVDGGHIEDPLGSVVRLHMSV